MHKVRVLSPLFVLLFGLIIKLATAGNAAAAHGISIDGSLKYPAGFTAFSYVNPEAPKGKSVVLPAMGAFDKMNPYTLKGTPPFGLGELVFETLAVPSLDEPFAEYGLLAKDMSLAADRLSVTFTLDPAARFSNGQEVTAEDVVFSLETMKSGAVHPFFPQYYQDIDHAEIIAPGVVRFVFKRVNRELHMIAGQLPVFSKKDYISKNGMTGMQIPVGSGPYIVETVNPGKLISYRRNPDYWAKNHPTRRGMYNFDTITVKYFKDPVVTLEAFKAGEFDFLPVNIAKQWARNMDGGPFTSGRLIKKQFPHHNNAGMQGFVMNTRRKIFADRRTRQAMGLALDFEWTNKTLYFGQYRRSESFFSNSPLAATGLPQGLELRYLEELRHLLPAEVFTTPPRAPVAGSAQALRRNLRHAKTLLAESGWQVKDGVLRNAADEPFQFEILLANPAFERVMAAYVENLAKLGMKVSYRTIDPAVYTERIRNFNFDMIVEVYGQSQSPGNEQRNFWSSAAAGQPGSDNYAGIDDKAIDTLIDKVIYADTQEELTAACRALDRALWYGYYLVPNWYIDNHRIGYRNTFGQPEKPPLFYHPYQLLWTWWGAGK
ncbi:MAG TPA: ABC transporter substrate-binding protein [Desulfobulbaceae bacterium]|nr:ABC transporter substrate-binding protein [Desulfobulbaceae bacterium]